MRRSTLLLWSSIALCSASLAPIWYAAGAIAAGTAKSDQAAATSVPDLHTVPEDGAEDDFPASSRLVRDLISARPNEDLVICVAGCRPGADRVIFAQPADPMARRTNVAAQPAASEPVAGNKDDAPTPAPAEATTSQSSEPPADSAAEAKPAEQETHMEPTAAEPEPSQDNANESDTETRSDETSDSDQSREHHHEAEPDPASGERSE